MILQCNLERTDTAMGALLVDDAVNKLYKQAVQVALIKRRSTGLQCCRSCYPSKKATISTLKVFNFAQFSVRTSNH